MVIKKIRLMAIRKYMGKSKGHQTRLKKTTAEKNMQEGKQM